MVSTLLTPPLAGCTPGEAAPGKHHFACGSVFARVLAAPHPSWQRLPPGLGSPARALRARKQLLWLGTVCTVLRPADTTQAEQAKRLPRLLWFLWKPGLARSCSWESTPCVIFIFSYVFTRISVLSSCPMTGRWKNCWMPQKHILGHLYQFSTECRVENQKSFLI